MKKLIYREEAFKHKNLFCKKLLLAKYGMSVDENLL